MTQRRSYRVLSWSKDKPFVDESYLSMRAAIDRFSDLTRALGDNQYELISKNQIEGGYQNGYCRIEVVTS